MAKCRFLSFSYTVGSIKIDTYLHNYSIAGYFIGKGIKQEIKDNECFCTDSH